MATKLDFLVRDYTNFRHDMSPKKRAACESAMWDLVEPTERDQFNVAGGRIGPWLVQQFGGSAHEYAQRYYLYRADRGDGIDPLWRRLADKRLALAKAASLHREAKKLAVTSRISVTSALAIVLDAYEKQPITKIVNGVPVRGNLPGKKRARRRSKKLDPKVFYAQLRSEMEQYAAQQLSDIDPDTVDTLLCELETDVSQILDDWSARVRRARANAQRRRKDDATITGIQNTISRRRFTEACRTLNITPAGQGKSIDLTAAKKAKRKLVRAYHPDLSGGDESTHAAYQAVVEAYQTIEEYAEYANSN